MRWTDIKWSWDPSPSAGSWGAAVPPRRRVPKGNWGGTGTWAEEGLLLCFGVQLDAGEEVVGCGWCWGSQA